MLRVWERGAHKYKSEERLKLGHCYVLEHVRIAVDRVDDIVVF